MEPRHTSPMNASGAAGAMPTIVRGAMLPRPWAGFWRGLLAAGAHATAAGAKPAAWETAARSRRRLLLALVVLATAFATIVLERSQAEFDHPLLQGTQVALFAPGVDGAPAARRPRQKPAQGRGSMAPRTMVGIAPAAPDAFIGEV